MPLAQEERKYVSTVVALFLLSQVFLIVSHGPLVRTLAAVILKSNLEVIRKGPSSVLEAFEEEVCRETVAFQPPKVSLEKSLENLSDALGGSAKLENVAEEEEDEAEAPGKRTSSSDNELPSDGAPGKDKENWYSIEKVDRDEEPEASSPAKSGEPEKDSSETIEDIKHLSVTDEEKEQRLALESPLAVEAADGAAPEQESLSNRPFLETVLNSLYCTENDYAALFGLCLLYALANNQVIFRQLARVR